MRTAILCILALLATFGCQAATGCAAGADAAGADAAACTRVLFIGNSYTYVNDLPGTFASLARAGGHPVEVGMAAPGGATLAEHAVSPDTAAKLAAGPWSVVVLQEQSEIPAAPDARRAGMAPAALALSTQARGTGARVLFFLTWAHRDGWPERGLPGYRRMQAEVTAGYEAIAHALAAGVAPVGEAWLSALLADPALELWQADGSHPTPAGTYLAASVFYAAIFGVSPEGLPPVDGVPAGTARELQQVAAKTVLGGQSRWGLP
jgi:hypothetical protein